jgi:hypothetical protein
MSIKRLKDLPDGSGSLTNDDIFLFMDDPSGSGITKKISLSDISGAIGGGGGGNPFDQNLNTTDSPTFNLLSLSNGTTLAKGTFDNSTGGQSGISLNCYVGYELNWQGGHLKSTQDNGVSSANIYCDSAIEFPGSGVDNVEINSSGIVFSDGTTQTSANISSLNITDFNSSVSGLLPVTNIIAGSGISLSSSNGSFTINATGVSGGTLSYNTVSPAISGTVNDWNPGSSSDVIRISGVSNARINGLISTYGIDAVLIYNVGTSGSIILTHTSGTSDNQFLVPWLADYTLGTNGGAVLVVRDKVDNKWRIT